MDAELENQIQALIEFIYSLSPDVRVERVSTIYEDEHANLKIYPPLAWDEERCLEFQHHIAEHSLDILVDSGYSILAYVYTAEEQIKQAQFKLAQARQQWESANQILANAADLGMLPRPVAV